MEAEDDIAGIGRVILRPIRPEDELLYASFFSRLTPDDVRMRFFTAKPDLSYKFLARLTQIDYAREMAFVAIAADSGELLASRASSPIPTIRGRSTASWCAPTSRPRGSAGA